MSDSKPITRARDKARGALFLAKNHLDAAAVAALDLAEAHAKLVGEANQAVRRIAEAAAYLDDEEGAAS